jgi:folate-dependent phosphoribosylglycinamide formyltransferase PurN
LTGDRQRQDSWDIHESGRAHINLNSLATINGNRLRAERFGQQCANEGKIAGPTLSGAHLVKLSFQSVHDAAFGTRLYHLANCQLRDTPPPEPLKVVILTSIRDVGKEERVGTCASPRDGSSYIKGTIETALKESVGGRLADYIEVVAIITDDLPKDLRGSDYVASPDQQGTWIFPRDLRTSSGKLATSITKNIPSSFRALPLKDEVGRKAAKLEFEHRVYNTVRQSGADIILSDHFLARFDFLINPSFYPMLGRVLNTHPGITRHDHPYTTCGKETYSHMRNHARGWRLQDDGTFKRVPPHSLAGASFHLVTSGIDEGPVLCDAELTAISPNDTDEEIARKMYATSKYHVFIEGIRHYASHIHPLLEPLRN